MVKCRILARVPLSASWLYEHNQASLVLPWTIKRFYGFFAATKRIRNGFNNLFEAAAVFYLHMGLQDTVLHILKQRASQATEDVTCQCAFTVARVVVQFRSHESLHNTGYLTTWVSVKEKPVGGFDGDGLRAVVLVNHC